MKPNYNVILPAVAISLVVHVIVLAVLLFVPGNSEGEEIVSLPLDIEVMALSEQLLEQLEAEVPLPVSADLRNLAQNLDNPTETQASHRTPTSAEMSEDVADELSQFEQDVFNELAQHHEEIETQSSDLERDEGGRYDDILSASSSGNVTASFSLQDRDLLYGPKPSYRCQVSGKVKIDIEVGQDGKVLNTQVNQAGSTTQNGCLLEESLKYAQRWIFRSKLSAPKRQQGFITFTFVAQ